MRFFRVWRNGGAPGAGGPKEFSLRRALEALLHRSPKKAVLTKEALLPQGPRDAVLPQDSEEAVLPRGPRALLSQGPREPVLTQDSEEAVLPQDPRALLSQGPNPNKVLLPQISPPSGPRNEEVSTTMRTKIDPRHVRIVKLAGELDAGDAPAIAERLERETRSSTPRLVINLEGVTFASAAVVGRLLEARANVRSRGGDLVLSGPSRFLARMLDTLGLGPERWVFPGDMEAIRDLLGASAGNGAVSRGANGPRVRWALRPPPTSGRCCSGSDRGG